MKKPIIYICHPISGDVQGNITKVLAIVRALSIENKVIPFAPYIVDVQALDDRIPEERAIGFSHNEALFKSDCIDLLFLYGSHISNGMRIEIEWARELGIPVISKSEGTAIW